jgi:hypothetical protein
MKTAEEVLCFVETQAPLLCEEIILWGAVSEIKKAGYSAEEINTVREIYNSDFMGKIVDKPRN